MASYETLLNLFERIQFFLQRLNHYTAVPLTPGFTLLLGKIMAQILIVLAFSMEQIKERRISMSFCLMFSFVVDSWTEKILKRIVGKMDLEDALQQLDILTREEALMMAARNLELTQIIHDNVEVSKLGVQRFLDTFIRIVTNLCLSYITTAMDEQQRSLLPNVLIPSVVAKRCAQGTICDRCFEHGYLPPTLLSIIILHVTPSTKEQQCGSSRATNTTNGGRTVRYCGFVAIVCVSTRQPLCDC
jgi:hypothetical protein